MNLRVRAMELRDVPAVAAIDRDSFSLPWPESSYRYEIQSNAAARCLVAENGDREVVAMIVAWLVVDELHIATIATRADHRRQGIGSTILKTALQWACERGAVRAYLEVRTGNEDAQAMYSKFGFVTTGRRPGYYKDNGEDAVLMTLEPLEVS